MSKHLTAQEVKSQEALTKELLKNIALENRPNANFIDLMNWTMSNFSEALVDQENLNKFVHNTILIDGQFIQFAKENKLKITCLFKDSVISWNSDENFEKFFMQGVFHISSNNVEFIHAALYHKGNQNEDEVSFFNIVSEANYDSYLILRNSFEKWCKARDRSNLHIKVIDGDDMSYTKDNKWEDLFLPQNLKNDIKKYIENFLGSKQFYEDNKIAWKTGCILHGAPGNGKSSLIRTIISEYDFKPITITAAANDEIIREAFAYAEEQSPSLLYFEDLDSLLEKNIDLSTFLNLMDGISSKNGLFVLATANYVHKLKPSIIDRPSRFDRKFEIPLPTKEMTEKYLSKWFGKMISKAKYKEISTTAVRYNFSYAYLKELYVSSMFEALAKNRKSPTEKDIDNTLKRLIKDKLMLNSNINTDQYLNKQG